MSLVLDWLKRFNLIKVKLMISTQPRDQQTEKIPTPASPGFDYATLDAETRSVVQQQTSGIKTLMRRTAQDIINIGQKLIEVKEQLGHGQFRTWLKAEFDWSVRTAARFMQVATKFKNAKLAHLDIAASALYLLAEPSTPNEAQKEALELAEQGENITYAKAKDIVVVNQHKEAAMLINSKPNNVDVPAETVGWEASPTAMTLLAEQIVEVHSATIIEQSEDKLLKEKEASAYLQLSSRYCESVPTANSGDYQSRDQAKTKMQSLLEVGHHICITDVGQQNYKWFGQIAEVKEATVTDLEVIIKITL